MYNNKLVIFYVDDLNNKKISIFFKNSYKELNHFFKSIWRYL